MKTKTLLLDRIKKANDIKKIKPSEYDALASEIRHFLVESVSETGGHLASNLGVVEMTMALHLCLDLPKDKIVWDVGHQSYVHKILTGRKDEFGTLRQYGGLSGFPKTRESNTDAFNTGHASTSISAALGLAKAEELKNGDAVIVAVIGDGSLTGGMAYEALNNASKLKRNLIIILNDNNMSISKSIGGVSSYLSAVRAAGPYNRLKEDVADKLRTTEAGKHVAGNIKRTKDNLKRAIVPDNIFEDMGITYLGPIDGHNIQAMKVIISEAKNINHPVLIHVCTKKGKGYIPAERYPEVFHGIGRFDPETGKTTASAKGRNYSDVFGSALTEAAERNKRIVAITAAMENGTGLKKFHKKFPERFFDVGIAEEHAVTFAAGLAQGGYKPFVAIYSSFLQRAYDQILHDVGILSLPVIFCVDRAGLVGEDGETHQGVFDLSYLQTVPGMSIISPKNAWDLKEAVKFAAHFNGPLAIRYPRGRAGGTFPGFCEPFVYGKSEILYKEKDIAIIAEGSMVETGAEVRRILKKEGKNVTLVNVRFVKPVDEEMLDELINDHELIVTIEDNVLAGGMGMTVLKKISDRDNSVKVLNFAVPNSYVEQGSRGLQLKECGLDALSIAAGIKEKL